ncbi:hypothetical protein [Aeromonas sp. R5-3]|uniref:hypothetical protein n=1 Tax=Aeromonas sp. R5-3 TaxID=3138469 RepID=UPI0034A39101
MFGIFIESKAIINNGEQVLPASIIIDDFKESMHIPLSYWNVSDYKKNWILSLEQGICDGKHAALVVSMYRPEVTNFVFAWVLYFEGSQVFVQNNVIFLDKCNEFSPDKINDFIDARTTYDEDGIKISEWNTDIENVISFFECLKDEMDQ